MDPTPLAFTLTGAVYALGVFRHRLLDLVPVARDALVERGDPVDRTLAAWPDFLERLRAGTRAQGELQIDAPGGSRWLDVAITTLALPGGGPPARLIVLADVTARRHTEDVLSQNEKLVSLGRMLGDVAHELNNPPAVVSGYAQLLRRQLAPGTVLERLEKIAAAAERCGRVVASFLAVAREHLPDAGPADVNRVLREAVGTLQDQLRADDIAVELDLAADLRSAWADSRQLHHVVANLVVNAHQAMRATGRPGRLTVRSWNDPERFRVLFSVADTGPGVPRAHRQRVFEPFFTTKPVAAGSGLGLSVAAGIVDAHHGSMRLADAPGGGAPFEVQLPAAREAPPGSETATGPRVRRGQRILVVTAAPALAKRLTEVLLPEDLEDEVAPNGMAALETLKTARFDLVLSDVAMPVLDGPGLYRGLGLVDADLRRRITFVTGGEASLEATRLVELTGAPTLGTPVDAAEVRRLVRDAVHGAEERLEQA